ncbi:uncharacterized protein PV07_00439 [Cladophialophora immunda]|uniref:VWFA domain-containing protein n=1 Tax=Cladophialophora immunda TaxID=569365 RepID=A0A0D2CQX9_9EURO|nr:uncharacterized protein PV07_00439 [Cladophialophora immunda]KIW33603.1 hypothetical protein PV07_00439 [Cladophialophora immunda]
MTSRRLRHEDFHVGWICALPLELAAAADMLDEEYQALPADSRDSNVYTFGRIAEHNVVLACLPAGRIGTNSAAAVAIQMISKFPAIRFGLMVGIGGGVPSGDSDVRLGDVVVSQPNAGRSGVIQYDPRKIIPGGYRQTGFLNSPPRVLLSALAKLQAQYLGDKRSHAGFLVRNRHRLDFADDPSNPEHDLLFEANYTHVVEGHTCDQCNKEKLVPRLSREPPGSMVHYGTIASGNQVIKDGVARDKLSSELGGPRAAATAAAFAKEVLSVIPPLGSVEPAADVSGLRIGDEHPRIAAEPVSQYQNIASEFIRENLNTFYDQDPAFREILAQTTAARAVGATEELGLSSEFTPKLTKLALYDFVLLCDDSTSMNIGSRISALQETVKSVAKFATILEPSGMSVRFINFKEDGQFNNLTDVDDIMQKVQMVDYSGNTRLGQRLRMKIVDPMILEKADTNSLKKPVIVAVVTDGEPTVEPPTTLGETMKTCKNWPSVRKLGEAAVAFLLCRVGDSVQAEAFFLGLEKDQNLRDVVYVSPYRIDDELAIFQRCGDDEGYRAWLIDLFYTALDSVTR